jgi:hypothetical protein
MKKKNISEKSENTILKNIIQTLIATIIILILSYILEQNFSPGTNYIDLYFISFIIIMVFGIIFFKHALNEKKKNKYILEKFETKIVENTTLVVTATIIILILCFIIERKFSPETDYFGPSSITFITLLVFAFKYFKNDHNEKINEEKYKKEQIKIAENEKKKEEKYKQKQIKMAQEKIEEEEQFKDNLVQTILHTIRRDCRNQLCILERYGNVETHPHYDLLDYHSPITEDLYNTCMKIGLKPYILEDIAYLYKKKEKLEKYINFIQKNKKFFVDYHKKHKKPHYIAKVYSRRIHVGIIKHIIRILVLDDHFENENNTSKHMELFDEINRFNSTEAYEDIKSHDNISEDDFLKKLKKKVDNKKWYDEPIQHQQEKDQQTMCPEKNIEEIEYYSKFN